MNIKSIKVLALSVGAALALTSGVSMAESQYGYNSAGTGTVTATAKVNLSVTVPKLILLKVGSSDSTGGVAVIDTLSWTATASIPNVPTIPTTGNNTGVVWDGTAPTIGAGTQPGSIAASAWTNATSATISCAVSAWSVTGGPANTDFAVTATGTLPHPGATLGACGPTTAITSNSLLSSTWAFVLSGTSAASWKAGAYTSTVTYTVSGI